MRIIADLEIHSKYARAVSKDMTPEHLALWAHYKGITVLGTGDFTHPLWFQELKEKLEPAEQGLFVLKKQFIPKEMIGVKQPRFLLSGEVSCIYSKNKKVRRVHHLIYAPSFEAAEKINTRLSWIGNLKSDGRPIIGIDSKELLKIVLEQPGGVLIPAHVWTPWFGVFGSKSGFDSLEECFDELTPHIFAIETGLSSNPPMNWRISWLDNIAIISSSDAHSLAKLGREATVFECELSYDALFGAIQNRDAKELLYTIEFFPEEGMYHYSGHRDHNISYSPSQEKEKKGICEVCAKPVVTGVMTRIEELADPSRTQGYNPGNRPLFKSLVPLQEIIAEAIDQGVSTKKVKSMYQSLIKAFSSEFSVLLDARIQDVARVSGEVLAEALGRVREGKLHITPGYDGVYGVVKIFSEQDRNRFGGGVKRQKPLF